MITPSFTLHKQDFPSDGEVRLYYSYDSPSYYSGLVEVYISEEWGTVDNDGSWTIEDGEVVCRQLGFEIPSETIYTIIIIEYFCGISNLVTFVTNLEVIK